MKQPSGLSEIGDDLQIGRMSWGCLDFLGFPGRHFVSSSPSSTKIGEKLSSGPFIRRLSKLVDILRNEGQGADRRQFEVTCDLVETC